MNDRNLIFVLVSILLIATCKDIYAQKKSTFDYSFYAGVQRKFIHGSGILINDPQLIDPTAPFPYVDSVRFLPNYSFHSGVAFSKNIINNIYFSIGIEWNLRKSDSKLYGDSIFDSGFLMPGYNREHNLFYNIEIPCYLSYNSKRFGVGGGIKLTLFEFNKWKAYYDELIISEEFNFGYLLRPLTNDYLYPIAYVEYLILSDLKLPLWIRASYEYCYNKSSIMYISLKTIL